MGLPLLGETRALVANPYRFLEDRQRRYGDVFTSHVLGHKVTFLSGLEGAERFYDRENIVRTAAHPVNFVKLFGGVNMEMYDGPRHFALKSMALTAFDMPAMEGYLPDMQQLIASTLERWSSRDEFKACAELRTLAIEAICWNVMGLPPGPDTDAITRDYGIVIPGLAAVPVPIPGTKFGRATKARNRLLNRLREVIRERLHHPTNDGLSRILEATAPDGRRYTYEEALLEVHHIVIAGFVVYAILAEVLRRLAEQPDLLGRCRTEVEEHAARGPLSMDALSPLSTCTAVVKEAKRIVPLVPLAFGRSARAFECGGYEVPKDWRVWLALHLVSHDASIYPEPWRFDPDRFAAGRAEHLAHRMAFIPQGAEPPTGHRCLGLDYSTVLTLTFMVLALRGYEWDLPAQDLEYDWTNVPPEPRAGLRVRMHPR
jgi:retinoid hydroxylase